jgi:hypothetical protein
MLGQKLSLRSLEIQYSEVCLRAIWQKLTNIHEEATYVFPSIHSQLTQGKLGYVFPLQKA